MAKTLILLILLTIIGETLIQRIYCKEPREYSQPRHRQKFNIISVPKELEEAYEILIRIQEEIRKQRLAIEYEKKLKEETKRRRIYEKHLLAYQGGSNVLKDFHTNQF